MNVWWCVVLLPKCAPSSWGCFLSLSLSLSLSLLFFFLFSWQATETRPNWPEPLLSLILLPSPRVEMSEKTKTPVSLILFWWPCLVCYPMPMRSTDNRAQATMAPPAPSNVSNQSLRWYNDEIHWCVQSQKVIRGKSHGLWIESMHLMHSKRQQDRYWYFF